MDDSWLLAYRFEDMMSAGEAYERVRNLILGPDVNASVYRTLIFGLAHVVVVGPGAALEAFRQDVAQACQSGEAAELPSDVSEYLIERSRESRIQGVFWERRSFLGVD